ncbi:MAG TPA: Nif3-like dinuclear metal center hexameric protein [Armatimonadetes bacterium]|nr:Nif3-like dinuclear metal center hexameric protein [Armatimonadota bacterium]
MLVREVVEWLNRLAPPELAEDWDNVGLLVGDPTAPVSKVLVTLDITEAVLAEAVEHRCELVLAHHPLIFRPLRRVRADDPTGRLVRFAVRHDLHVLVAHTNLDRAPLGTSEALAQRLNLQEVRVLSPATQAGDYKLVVFVPPEAVDQVLQAMSEAGAGRIGAYSHCTFRTPGTGTYRPLPGAQPYAGTVGQLEQAEEYRLETVVPRLALGRVVAAMKEAHPYEEVAYDVYRLENCATPVGTGRLGRLVKPQPLEDFAAEVKERLKATSCRLVGDPQRPIRTVAVVGGSGASFLDAAERAKADVLVTGDVRHHDAWHARALGLAVIDPGHYATERPMVSFLAARLREDCPPLDEVRETEYITEPLTAVPSAGAGG